MSDKPRSLRMGDAIWDWLRTRAESRGTSMSAEAEAIFTRAREEEAGQAVQETAAPALHEAVAVAVKEQLAGLGQQLLPLLEVLTVEAMRARMTGEEHLAYLYDGDNIVCPYCQKRYKDYQNASTFAQQRSAVIARRATDILAAGKVPRLRVW